MPITIRINTGRIDWPHHESIDLENTLSYADVKRQYPELFENSRRLLVREKEKWRQVRDHEKLIPSLSYRTESYMGEKDYAAASLVCTQCDTAFKNVEELRYHSGDLSAHEWVYNLTFSWEWSCCNTIVSTQQIQRFDASQGCNIGRCQHCRDNTPYHKAIAQHQREEKEAGECF